MGGLCVSWMARAIGLSGRSSEADPDNAEYANKAVFCEASRILLADLRVTIDFRLS